VGLSLGGALIADLALVRPEAIAGAVMVVPVCLHPGEGADAGVVTN